MTSMFKNILVATDFSEPSSAATGLAVDLATTLGSALTLVHVFDLPGYAYAGTPFTIVDLLAPVEEAAQAELDRALESVKRRVPAARAMLRRGAPWQEILRAIEESRADLVVLGTRGRQGVTRALLGSVAEKVVRMSPVPVLTLQAPPRAERKVA
jgi:nucleotide-binding universal stress UspA family protein